MGDEEKSMGRRRVLAAAGVLGAGALAGGANERYGVRQGILAMANPVAGLVGLYTAYRLLDAEYVGMIPSDESADWAGALGYEPMLLSAAKYHPDRDRLDDRSLRRIDEEHPRWQWHVHLFRVDERIEVFSHYEYRPDPHRIADETFPEMRQRIEDHYNPTWDTRVDDGESATYFLGKACPRIRDLVE